MFSIDWDYSEPLLHSTPMTKTPPATLATRLHGRWRLASYVARAADGRLRHPMGERAAGVLDYSRDGKVSVHIRDPADGRYFAYYGDAEFDEAARTVTHVIELSSDAGFVGARNLRHAALDAAGGTLVLSGPMAIDGAPHLIEVTWRREA